MRSLISTPIFTTTEDSIAELIFIFFLERGRLAGGRNGGGSCEKNYIGVRYYRIGRLVDSEKNKK
jgi:hypothetical protein